MTLIRFNGGSMAMPTASALLIQAATNLEMAGPFTWGSSALASATEPASPPPRLPAIERAAERWGFASVLEGGAK
jgi:hypothetical protein